MNGILPCRFEEVWLERGGLPLLADLDTRLEAGPRSIVLGPNGAGKSLFLRLAHGLIAPSRGRVHWRGERPARRQAMVFQRPVLLRRSVAANLDYVLRLRGLPSTQRREQRAAVLERTGLTALAARPARVLSGGEQQRLALARAWALEPEVLLLDEPTANLDPTGTRAVEAIIQAIHEAGTKIVMTTHDLGQARRLADEILFLHQGRLLEQAPAARFFEAPASPEAAAFLKGDLLW